MALHATVDVGHVIQNAIIFDFKRHGATVSMNDILQSVDDLFDLLESRQIDYLLVGGIAMLQYVAGRNTEDIDLIAAAPALQRVPEIQISQQDQDFARGAFAGLQIDFLLTGNRLFEQVHARYSAQGSVGKRSIAVATVEGLLLLKLYALPSLYRQGNFARVALYEGDIITLMEAYAPDMDLLLTELGAHLSPADLSEVRAIVAELQQRIARFARTFPPAQHPG